MAGAGPARPAGPLARPLLALLATAIVLLCAEGALSLCGGPSLRALLLRSFGAGDEAADAPLVRAVRAAREARDARGAEIAGVAGAGAAATGGRPEAALALSNFAMHPDPAVGRTFLPEARIEVNGVPATTDALGMRARVGPARGAAIPSASGGDATGGVAPGSHASTGGPAGAAECVRVVILGDSVAFGWGLRDDETLASRLEALLAEHLAPEARPVEVRTVAVPGWNHRNAFAFLFDHLDVLDPDVVVYLPVANDLADDVAAWPTAHGALQVSDISSDDPWLHVGYPAAIVIDLLARRERGESVISLKQAGAVALDGCVGPTSRARLARMARALVASQARLAALGARLYVAPHVADEFAVQLLEALLDEGARVPRIPLLAHAEPEDMLPTDPHPSAEAVQNFAVWIAEALVVGGGQEDAAASSAGPLIGPLASPLPAVPADVAARRAAVLSDEALRARAATGRQAALADVLPEVDLRTGRGCLQVYGGIGAGGEIGTRALLLLRRDADVLRLAVQGIPARPDLLPLRIEVLVNGVTVGGITLRGEAGAEPAPQDFEIALPPGERGEPIDIKLIPERWASLANADGGFRLASCRLLAADCKAR